MKTFIKPFWLVAALASAIVVIGAASCGTAVGACDSTGRYCGDNYSEEECDRYNREEINAVNWYFHPGQTCSERGKASTS